MTMVFNDPECGRIIKQPLFDSESAARHALRVVPGRDTCDGVCETRAGCACFTPTAPLDSDSAARYALRTLAPYNVDGCACWRDGQPRAAESATELGLTDYTDVWSSRWMEHMERLRHAVLVGAVLLVAAIADVVVVAVKS